MNRINNDRLKTLTPAETKIYILMMKNPMLDNRELAGLCGCAIQTLKNNLSAIYEKLTPKGVYNTSSFSKRRLYIHLNYDLRFAKMPDSWREAFIDPMFNTRRKS